MKRLLALSVSTILIISLACKDKAEPITEGHDLVITELPDGRDSGKIHEIVLNVNTSEITQTTTDEYADFGQEDTISNEDYTTKVSKGDIIIWRGVSTVDPISDVVNIVLIRHEEGKRLLGRNALQGNNGDPGMVVGMIGKDVSEVISDIKYEKYSLHFTVYNDGIRRNGVFKIDPKLLPDY